MLERFRPVLKIILEPIAKRINIDPNIVTLCSPIIATISALSFSYGNLIFGGIFIFLSGLLDVFDGAIARYHQKTSRFGAFLDSTMDRFSDAIIIIGLILGGYTTWIMGILAIHSSLTVSYVRASAESKGIPCNVGIGERAVRLIILMIGAIMGTYIDRIYMSFAILILVFISYITVVQRIYYVWKFTKKNNL